MLQSKPLIIIGLGKTGLSCVRYLAQQKISLLIMDTRDNPPGLAEFKQEFPHIPIHLGKLDPGIIAQAAEIIVSPGISLQEPALVFAREQKIPIIGDIELFARAAQAPIIAITGTNAKGTVTTLIGEMINQAGFTALLGGNIGTPALDLLLEKIPDFYVLELSSFQLESTFSLQATAATILNISEDHLDWHGTMAAYIQAKQRIYQHCKIAVWNRDDLVTFPEGVEHYVSFGLSEAEDGEFGLWYVNQQPWLAYGKQPLLPVTELRIKGRHNWANALAALAFGHALKLPWEPMLQVLRTFKGLEHRCQWVAEYNQVAWYNDSKGTNVGATIAAIEGLGGAIAGKLILIAGGIGKGADFTVLQPAVAKYARTVILIGRDAPLLQQALSPVITTEIVHDLAEAVLLAQKAAKAHDIVLLSPACASFDMFRDYPHRGEVFKDLVRNLTP